MPYNINNILSPVEFQIKRFADGLANKSFPQFAPPFNNYIISHRDIISYLRMFFTAYLKEVGKLGSDDISGLILKQNLWLESRWLNTPPVFFPEKINLYESTEELCSTIIRVLEFYFRGYPGKAYYVFKDFFEKDNCHMIQMLPQLQSLNGPFDLYRMRKGRHFQVRDVFHIPFHKRFACDSYRFSIAGLPALYCAASIETCVLENNHFNGEQGEVTGVCFHLPNASFVDLALPGEKELSFWEQYSLILFYPLIVACGLKVKEPNAPFKPEYVIPQIFYQVLREQSLEFAGISFTSTKYPQPDFTNYAQRNFVVFVYGTLREYGYNESLARWMTVSGPVAFDYPHDTPIQMERILDIHVPQSIIL